MVDVNVSTALPQFINTKVHIGDIVVKDRSRTDYGNLAELTENIKRVGLLNPITVGRVNNELRLFAGERRLKACLAAGIVEVDVRLKEGEVEPYELVLIELSENLQRKAFTYEEELSAKKRVHELMQSVHGASRPGSNAGHTIADTANIFGESAANMRRDIRLAETLENLGDLKGKVLEGCKTKADVTRKLEQAKRVAATAQAVAKFDSSIGELQQRMMNAYKVIPLVEDKPLTEQGFFAGVVEIGAETVDFAEIDPPYGVDLVNSKKGNMDGLANYEEVETKDYSVFISKLLEETFRVLKPNRFAILWYGESLISHTQYFPCGCGTTTEVTSTQRRSNLLTQQAIKAGFTVSPIPGLWVKQNFAGQTQTPKYALANCYEAFLILRKGSPELVKQGAGNVFAATPVAAQNKIHPTERPESLLTDILNVFCSAGNFVLVPFAGSGATMLTAEKLKMHSVGFDVVNDFRNRYLLRVAQRYGKEA